MAAPANYPDELRERAVRLRAVDKMQLVGDPGPGCGSRSAVPAIAECGVFAVLTAPELRPMPVARPVPALDAIGILSTHVDGGSQTDSAWSAAIGGWLALR